MVPRTLVVFAAVLALAVLVYFMSRKRRPSGEDEPAWKQKQSECNAQTGMRWFEGECMAAKPFCRARGKWWYKDRCNDKYDASAVASGGGGTSDWGVEKERCEKRGKKWYQSTCMTLAQFCTARDKIWNEEKSRCDNPPTAPSGDE